MCTRLLILRCPVADHPTQLLPRATSFLANERKCKKTKTILGTHVIKIIPSTYPYQGKERNGREGWNREGCGFDLYPSSIVSKSDVCLALSQLRHPPESNHQASLCQAKTPDQRRGEGRNEHGRSVVAVPRRAHTTIL